MSDTPTVEQLAALRAPFAPEVVGKLPRTTCKKCSNSPTRVCSEHQKRECPRCKNYMTSAHIDLDYVGHAHVTDRLLSVDPAWSWEPVAWTDDGLPRVANEGGRLVLWIKLTVLGVTRLGVGTTQASKPEPEKELIGDALRNAAMRFGVALDLWAKGDLHAPEDEPAAKGEAETDWWADNGWSGQAEHDAHRDELRKASAALPADARDEIRAWLADQGWRFPYSRGQMDAWRERVETETEAAVDAAEGAGAGDGPLEEAVDPGPGETEGAES